MKQTVFYAALALLLIACKKENKDNPQGDPVVTAEAAEVTMNSAVLYGYVNPELLLTGKEYGFIISTSSTPYPDNGQTVVSSEVDKNGRFSVLVSGLTASTTYYYKAFLNIGAANLVGEVKSFTTRKFGCVAIDMGLSVKWSNANLGATSPEGYGDYYAWGETEPKAEYTWFTYKWCNDDYNLLTKYCPSDKATYWDGPGSPDDKTVLDPEDDAARVELGGKWRMPTAAEIDELVATTNNAGYEWEWKSLNGHNGWLVTYLVNNNSIFLPAAGYRYYTDSYRVGSIGYFWSSTLNTGFPNSAWDLDYDSSPVYKDYGSRYFGQSIRPVSE